MIFTFGVFAAVTASTSTVTTHPVRDPYTTWDTDVLGSIRVFDAVARSGTQTSGNGRHGQDRMHSRLQVL